MIRKDRRLNVCDGAPARIRTADLLITNQKAS